MKERSTEEQPAPRRVSRRTFLRWAGCAGVAATVETLAGCDASSVQPTTAPSATTAPTSTLPPPAITNTPASAPTSTAVASSTPTEAPTATPVPITGLFDESALTPVYVAHDPDVRDYPASPPFDPDTSYPEYPYPSDALGAGNGCYRLVRDALRLLSPLGYGQPDWNPLGGIIQPGDRVLIKPNLVDDSTWKQGQMTHPAFLRPIVDYAVKACGPDGQVIVGEGPWAAGVFDRVVKNTGIQAMVKHLAQQHGAPVVLRDLNKASREQTPLVDLGAVSALTLDERIWLDAHYNPMNPGGELGAGPYSIAQTVLQADIVISVPKIKVHCSGGITVTMKNMLGIIPAWDGRYEEAVLKDCAHASKLDMEQGNHGKYLNNDTIWRSMSDLNRILLYADSLGQLQSSRQRRYLTIVDGIIAAEESQYSPNPYPLSTVIVSTDPVTCDAISARVMGFDPRKLRSVTQPERIPTHPLGPWRPADIRLVTSWGGSLNTLYRTCLTPELHVYSWQGQVEADDFDPPQVGTVTWDAETGLLRAHIEDRAGVSHARLAYQWQGQHYVHDLVLEAGDPSAGQWSAVLPPAFEVRQGELSMGDALFNQASVQLAW